MKRKVSKSSGKNKKNIIVIAAIVVAIAVIGPIVFSAVKEANEVKNFDSHSFHLGTMLSSLTNIVNASNGMGNVSDEERETYIELEAKISPDGEIKVEDYIACLQYAESLNLGDEKKIVEQTIILLQNDSENTVITGEAFFGGYAVGALMPAISIYNSLGKVSDEEYKDMAKRYMELMKRPTEKKLYEFVEKGNEILILAGF